MFLNIFKEMNYYDENGYGYISYVLDTKLFVCTIIDFYIKKEHRGKHYGNRLLINFIKFMKTLNIKQIILDDMSDRFNQKNNIYVLNGFKYYNNGYPEMYLNLI
jgi:GNAT superfamily N-acetyltransferase